MTTAPIARRDGQTTELDDAAVDGLALRGEMLRPGDEGYDAARTYDPTNLFRVDNNIDPQP